MRWRLQPRAMEAATPCARSAFLAALLVLVPLCRAFSRRREWHNWHLKVSAEAIAARNSLPWLERQLSMEQVTHHRLKAWGLSKITGLGLGIFAGLAGALAVLVSGVVDFFLLPDRWARRYGALGFLTGLPATVAVAVLRPVYAALVLADRILTGTYNAAAQRLDPLGQRWPQVSALPSYHPSTRSGSAGRR